MSAPETLDAKELAQTNESLREQQRAVSNVLRAVARSQGLQPVLDEIVESATLLCAGDNGRLWLVKDGLLLAAAQYGSPPETYEYDVEHPHSVDRSSLAGRVALTQAPVHIPDILADPEYTYPGPRPYRAMLGVPVLIENDLLGVVAVVRIPPEPFAKEHIELVRTFADQAAIAIANARLIDAVERQRTELSPLRLAAGRRAPLQRAGRAAAGRTPRLHLLPLLRSARLHRLRRDSRARRAVGTLARVSQARFDQLADTWRKRGSDLGLGIGIAAGYATLGRIGFEGRYDYGALGPVTNLASRLSTHAEPGKILISQRVLADVEDVVDADPVGEIELKGFGRPVVAYDVRGLG